MQRPAYQGSNPISDYWSLKSLEMLSDNFELAVKDPSAVDARSQMILASTFAGIGFGNAGCHLCHGMSYPIAGMAHDLHYHPKDYPTDHPMVPHGISVVLTAPAVFKFTASSDPERHIRAAHALGSDTTRLFNSDAGPVLSDRILYFMDSLKMPNGLKAVGYSDNDLDQLVEGALPQQRVLQLSPIPVGRKELRNIYEHSMSVY
eukprot:TRINITY_DN5704_c0_g1_i1.p1 TRINITY_DN5704_c0_g1~~TRINITY_DN5704_c0_g1_i1.p1  ORF type:complete len:204 (+),score=42.14 TRINITY_DN5704_c0_g1_i1:207-818(+)